MKVYLIASVSALVLACGVATAATPISPAAPVRNVQRMNMPDCPTGFMKVNATGNPASTHSFTCTTQQIQCPQEGPNGSMAQPQAKTMGSGIQERVQFSFTCSYVQVN